MQREEEVQSSRDKSRPGRWKTSTEGNVAGSVRVEEFHVSAGNHCKGPDLNERQESLRERGGKRRTEKNTSAKL